MIAIIKRSVTYKVAGKQKRTEEMCDYHHGLLNLDEDSLAR